MVLLDGVPSIQANLLVVDFRKEDFDRRCLLQPPYFEVSDASTPTSHFAEGDPPPAAAFEVVNQFLVRLRTLTRGNQIRSLNAGQTFWRLDYLTDQGELLPLDGIHHRRRASGPQRWSAIAITTDIWRETQELPQNYTPPPWDTLLLDAEDHLPEVGPAITLAYAALESFSVWLLDEMASRAVLPPGFWDWLNDREDDHYKHPSVQERFDDLLGFLGGRSLKSESGLWEVFVQLRQARNSFMHRGMAAIGKKEKTPVNVEKARELVVKAKAIVEWAEQFLPEAARRPRLTKLIQFEFRKNAMGQAF